MNAEESIRRAQLTASSTRLKCWVILQADGQLSVTCDPDAAVKAQILEVITPVEEVDR